MPQLMHPGLSKMRSAIMRGLFGTARTGLSGVTTATGATYARPHARRWSHAEYSGSLIPNSAAIRATGARAWAMTATVSRSRGVGSKVIARSYILKFFFEAADRAWPRIPYKVQVRFCR
jgi:hypothetical protein